MGCAFGVEVIIWEEGKGFGKGGRKDCKNIDPRSLDGPIDGKYRVHELAVSGISTTFLTVTAGAAAEFFGWLACLRSTCGLLSTAAAEGLEHLTTAKPKIDLLFNGSGFLMTALSEVSLKLGCAPRKSTWAVDKASITSFLSATVGGYYMADLIKMIINQRIASVRVTGMRSRSASMAGWSTAIWQSSAGGAKAVNPCQGADPDMLLFSHW